MAEPFFISYSSVDGKDFSLKLADELEAGPPQIAVWLDKRKLQPGDDWDSQIDKALKTCKGLLLVMTEDSVDEHSICKNEWVQALRYKKSVIPLRFAKNAQLPFRLSSRHFIDFTPSFDTGIAKLRSHFTWLDSPEGQLRAFEYRLEEAQRDLRRARPEEEARIREEIVDLKHQIEQQQELIANPQEAEKRVEQSIKQGLERERQPEKPVSGQKHSKFINPPPLVSPAWFQNRHNETRSIGEFLKDEALRLMTIVGRGGIGKSAMVCRLLRSLEGGQFPDGGGALSVEGIVYLSDTLASNRVNVPDLYISLMELIPAEAKKSLDVLYKNPQTSPRQLVQALAASFATGRNVVVLLDNFEDEVEAETGRIKDPELHQALCALLELPPHGLKVIITTRVAPQDLMLVQPGLQQRMNLDEGLKSEDAEKMLRDMDKNGTVGLKNASQELLWQAQERTRGFPRALEYLFGILAADRDTSLQEIIQDTGRVLPEKVVDVLVGEAFSRLDPTAQRIMQALAIYRYPAPPAAVDYLLQPYVVGINSSPVLGRLVNMQFIRREAGRYYLHQIDQDYALSRIPEGEPIDRESASPPFSHFTLQHRAAEWFKLARKPREHWKTLDDLSAQLAEFELRYAGEDFNTAADVLLEIDFDYLRLWGHYQLSANLYERLQGKISDPHSKMESANSLGIAYYRMGHYQQAILCYEEALRLAREQHNRSSEGTYLGNLGNCYGDLGQAEKAIEYYNQTLAITRQTGDRANEAVCLAGLAATYAELGQNSKAIGHYNAALAIDREINKRDNEATSLVNLGERYAELGQTIDAMQHLQNALEIAKKIGFRAIEAAAISCIGDTYRDQGNLEDAVQQYEGAIKIADEIRYNQSQNTARLGLALTFLYQGELPAALEMAEAARKHDFPLNNHAVSAIVGVVILIQGDHYKAQQAFDTALHQAGELLAKSQQNYYALGTKGLAHCGLALCESKEEHISAATEAYKAAREITSAAGIVANTLRLFDTLARADKNSILTSVRAYAAGEKVE